ncbi:hypothetical protein [Fictibacillus sp. NRS-1165]|uniref:hypothetical protein n=1 Tax=Fictibacillus sp. NRS-1165 TaxID=3144463 RepID=UPI003D1F02E7
MNNKKRMLSVFTSTIFLTSILTLPVSQPVNALTHTKEKGVEDFYTSFEQNQPQPS